MGRRKIDVDINQISEELHIFQKTHNRVPTSRDIKNISNIPCLEILRRNFGSFENILKLCNIDYNIEFNNFNKKIVSDDTALELLKYYTDEKLKTEICLLTVNEINQNINMPSASIYFTRLGGLKNAYKMIGYNYDEYNYNALKQHYLQQYINLSQILRFTPTSRDVDKYVREGVICSSKTLIKYFGSIKELQNCANLTQTKHAYPTKTKEEMINDLKILSKKLNRVPTQRDLVDNKITLSSNSYSNYFGSFNNALIECGFEKHQLNNRIYVTPNGTKCYSRLEYLFARVLEKNNIIFEKDIKYKDLILNFDKQYTCDFKIYINNESYLVEIFGITGDKLYEEKIKIKIDLCNENNLKLIQIYPQLLWNSKQSEILEYVLEQIKIFD